jgi:hypothetical protein
MSLSGQLRRLGIETNEGNVRVLTNLISRNQISSPGRIIYVAPSSGSDLRAGTTPDKALKTLATALAMATANANDIVVLIAEGNASAAATDYQAETLDWNKDLTHLVGLNAGALFAQRSRIAFASTYATAANLFTLTANACLINNISMFAGVDSTTPTGICLKMVGMRNRLSNCHVAGIGNDKMDKAGAADVWFYDSSENLIEDCVLGIDTVKRGTAANSGLLFTTAAGVGSARNVFRRCIFPAWCESAGNYVFVKAAVANALDRFLLFDNCVMHNCGAAVAGGAQMTQAMSIHAAVNAHVILHETTIIGADNVNTADTGLILVGAGGLSAVTEATDLGLAVVTTNA